jgi:hypothetical protein
LALGAGLPEPQLRTKSIAKTRKDMRQTCFIADSLCTVINRGFATFGPDRKINEALTEKGPGQRRRTFFFFRRKKDDPSKIVEIQAH